MEKRNKDKPYSKEELLKIIREGSQAPSDMDDFEREAMEGLSLLKDPGILDVLNKDLDSRLKKDKNKKRAFYYVSAAAALFLLIGLLFLFKDSLYTSKQTTLALSEPKTKHETRPDNPERNSQTTSVIENPQKKEIKTISEKQQTGHVAATPVATEKEDNQVSTSETKESPVRQMESIPVISHANAERSEKNLTEKTKPEKQDLLAYEGEEAKTNSNLTMKSALNVNKNTADESNSPAPPAYSPAAANTSPPTATPPTEKNPAFLKSNRDALFYTDEAAKKKRSQSYQEPAYPGGDTVFIHFVQQHLNISSPNSKGTLVVAFIVAIDSSAHHIEVIHGIPDCGACSEDAIRLIESVKKWIPALMDGKKIEAPKKISIPYN